MNTPNQDENAASVLEMVRWFSIDDLAPMAFLKSELVPEKLSEYEFAELVRAEIFRRIAGVVYYQQRIYVPLNIDVKPKAAAVAVMLCRKNDWRMTVPGALARFWLGLEVRPNDFHEVIYDQPKARYIDDVDLMFLPATDLNIFDLSPIGQTIKLGIPANATDRELLELGRYAAEVFFDNDAARDKLRQDIVSGIFDERELLVANIMLESPSKLEVKRSAPADFNPADHEDYAPRIWNWSTFEQGGETFLMSRRIENHPVIGDGDRLTRSSRLIWIDEARGWARTRSRYYRLMGEHDNDSS